MSGSSALFSADANSTFPLTSVASKELINDLRRAAADIFEIQFYRSSEENAFELTNDPYWVTHHTRDFDSRSERALRSSAALEAPSSAPTRAHDQTCTGELVLCNTGNLNWAFLQSLNDTKASSQFEARLDDAIRTTKAIIEATFERGRAREPGNRLSRCTQDSLGRVPRRDHGGSAH